MILVPQGAFGGNRKSPVVPFSQSEFIEMGIQSYTASATKRWHKIIGEKFDNATLQGLKLSGWSDSTMTLGIINIGVWSPQYNGSGVELTSVALATSLVNQQNSVDGTLYNRWAIQIVATTDTLAAKQKTVFWKDFTDAQKLYTLKKYDQLYIDIAVVFSGGTFIDLNPHLEVLPFMAD